MRDAISVQATRDKGPEARPFFMRACAIAVAVCSFTFVGGHAGAQSLDPVAQRVVHLAEDGTLAAPSATHVEFDRCASAKLVADRIDDLALHPASRADVETLRELIYALKDELDAANIRIDDLQERLDTDAATRHAVVPLPNNEQLGAPLDPLSEAAVLRGSVAARLWGRTTSNSMIAGEIPLALDTLDGSTVVGSSLLTKTMGVLGSDVAMSVFSVEASTELSLPQADVAVLRAHDVADVPPSVKASNAEPSDVHTQVLQPAPGDVKSLIVTPLPIAKVIQPSAAPAHLLVAYTKQANTFSESIVTNASFDRALRAAGMSSMQAMSMQGSFFNYPETIARMPSSFNPSAVAYQAYLPNSAHTIVGVATLPVKLGSARVTTKANLRHVEQGSTDGTLPISADARGRYDAATVNTSFIVPAFHKNVTINVGGGYDHLHRPDTTTLPYYPYDTSGANYDAASVAPGGAIGDGTSSIASAANTNATDTERYTYGAGAAMPVAPNLKIGVGYSSQHLSGTYGASPGEPLADRKDAYSGSLTYAPHGGKSSVTLVGRQYRYSDDSVPNSTYVEKRGDVMFSVKF